MGRPEARIRYWFERERKAAVELEAFLDARLGMDDCFEILVRRHLKKLVRVLEAESAWMNARKARVRLERATAQIRSCRAVLGFLCSEADLTHDEHLRALEWLSRIERVVKPAYESASTRVNTSNDLS